MAGGDSADPRLSYFLENMQSYRMWMEEGGTGALWFYDEHGELTHGGAREAVAPRIAQLSDQLQAVLSDGIGLQDGLSSPLNKGMTRRQLEHAAKLEAEIEDLRLIDQRNIQNLVQRTGTESEIGQPSHARARQRTKTGVSSSSFSKARKSGSSRSGSLLAKTSFLVGVRASRLFHSSSQQFSKNISKLEKYLDSLPSDDGASSFGTVSRESTGGAPSPTRRASSRRDSPTRGSVIRGASPAGVRTARPETQQKKGETLDVFLQLNATNCDTEETLRLAFAALDLPESLSSAKRVAHHRSRRMKRMQKLTDELERALRDPD